MISFNACLFKSPNKNQGFFRQGHYKKTVLITYIADLSGTTKIETIMITVCWTEFYITYMPNLSATTKIETLMITVCWTEFYIKYV